MRKGEMGETRALEARPRLSSVQVSLPLPISTFNPALFFFPFLSLPLPPLSFSLSLIVIQPRHDLAPVPR